MFNNNMKIFWDRIILFIRKHCDVREENLYFNPE